MTATINNTGSEIVGIIHYLFVGNAKTKRDSTKVSIVASKGVDTCNSRSISNSFNIQKLHNKRLKNNIMHISLNFSNKDMIPEKEYKSYIKAYFETLYEESKEKKNPIDLREAQYVAILHKDTDNKHIHLVINRVINKVNRFGRAVSVSESNIKIHSKHACLSIAKKNKLHLSTLEKEYTKKDKIRENHKTYFKESTKNKYYENKNQTHTFLKNKYFESFRTAYNTADNIEDYFSYLREHTDLEIEKTEIKAPKTVPVPAFKFLGKIPKNREDIINESRRISFFSNDLHKIFSNLNVEKKYAVTSTTYILEIKKSFETPKNSKYTLITALNKSQNRLEFIKKARLQGFFVGFKDDKITKVEKDGKDILKPLNIKINDIDNLYQNRDALHFFPKITAVQLNYNTYINTKERLKFAIFAALKKAKTLEKLELLLYEKKVHLKMRKDTKGNIVSLSFVDENDISFAGSLLHYSLSAKKIQARLAQQKTTNTQLKKKH